MSIKPDPHIAELLKADALKLWNTKRGQELVERTPPGLHRLLAAYFNIIIDQIDVQRKIKEGEAKGEDMTVAHFEGQGWVVHPIQKVLAGLEKSARQAEKNLDITPSALAGTGADDGEGGDSSGY